MYCCKCKNEIPEGSVFCMFCGAKQTEDKPTRKPKSRGNGTGSVYRMSNGKYRAVVTIGYDQNQKRKCRTKSGFRTKKEALEYLPLLRNDNARPKDIYFWKLHDEWKRVAESTLSESSLTGYENCYNKYCESIKGKRVSTIRTVDLQECVDSCDQSPRMKQLVKVTLSTMLKYAEQNDYVKKNYATFVKVPRQAKPDKDAFNENEINQIWAEYEGGNIFMRYVLVMIYTGLRPAEVRQITPDRVNIAEKTLIAGVKTESGIDREIPLCDKIIPLMPDIVINFTRNQFYKYYKAAFKRAAIRYLPPHCCRHTTATALVLAGVDPKIIQEILGHSSYSVTADNYVHIPMASKIDAVNKI